MNIQQVIDSYKDIIKNRKAELSKLKNTIFKVGSVRLAVVVLGAVASQK